MKAVLCCLESYDYITLSPHYLKEYARKDEGVRETYSFDILHPSTDQEADRLAEEILSRSPDVVGFTTFLWNIEKTLQVSELLKKKNERLIILWGGVEATIQRENYMKGYPCVDVIVAGEGERAFLGLLKVFMTAGKEGLDKVRGIVYREAGEIRVSPRGEVMKNLSEIPSIFLGGDSVPPVGPLQMVETMRGCNYGCAYCVWHRYAPLRYFPLDRVLEEIKYLMGQSKIKSLYFCDADILFSKERSLAVWETIVKHNVHHISCVFEVNPENFEPEHIDFLSRFKTGGFQFNCAFQTFNKDLNKVLNRVVDMEKVRDNLHRVRTRCPAHSLVIEYTYAWPHQTMETFVRDTLDAAIRLHPHYIMGLHFLVLPGTVFYEQPGKYGIVSHEKKAPYKVLETQTMSRFEIDNLHTICQCVGAAYRRRPLRESFFQLMPHIPDKSFGQLYVELAMHLISHGGADFHKEPVLMRHYGDYVKKLCQEYRLSDDVLREHSRILARESEASRHAGEGGPA